MEVTILDGKRTMHASDLTPPDSKRYRLADKDISPSPSNEASMHMPPPYARMGPKPSRTPSSTGVPSPDCGRASVKTEPGVVERSASVVSLSASHQGLTYCSELMHAMNDFRESEVLCDVTICVEGQTFHAHRTILAASSPYFKALFSNNMKENSESKPIVLTDIDAGNMDCLLKYIYTGEIELTQENIRPIISAANYLLIQSLKDRCTKFLQKMLTPTNCLSIENTAERFDCEWLKTTTTNYIRENFIAIAATDEFKDLSLDRLTQLVSSDETKVEREEQIFEAIMKWVTHNVENRKQHFKDLILHVRFPLMSPYYLMDHVESEELVRETPDCIALLLEAKNYHMLPDRRWQLKSQRTTPRTSMGIVNGIIAVGGIQGRYFENSDDAILFLTLLLFTRSFLLYPYFMYS